MVLGSRIDAAAPVIPVCERGTVQALKEIARNHSDLEIYAMLKDSNMDPDETAQKLLNQDHFHEVRRRKDKKKENAGARAQSEPWKQLESNHLPSYRNNIHVTVERNARGGFYRRSHLSGGNHEFRVVRDNRVNNSDSEVKKNVSNTTISDDNHVARFASDKRSSEILTTKLHTARGLEHKFQQDVTSRVSAANAQAKTVVPVGPHNSTSEREKTILSNPTVQPPNDNTRISEMLPSPASSSSAIGVYSSSSDPVHVPSPVPRSVGTVGASRREVGVVGKRSTSQSSLPNGTSVPANGKDVPAPSNSSSQTGNNVPNKSTQHSQTSSSDHTVPVLVGRSFSNNLHGNKQMQQQSMGHQKASTSNMEWKPKPNQRVTRSDASGASAPAASVSGSSWTHSDTAVNPEVEVSSLADKLLESDIAENKHVIIPPHLRVPETERAHVTFGSFGKETADIPTVEPSVSIPSCPVEPAHITLPEDNTDLADNQTATSSLESPHPTADAGILAPENGESLSSQHMESYADIGLVDDHSPEHPIENHQIQPESDLSSIPAYSLSQNYEAPFFRPASEDNSVIQELSSSPETLTAYAANSSPSTLTSGMSHHQPSVQQQPATQLYPHVQFSHFPNFLPYRQFVPPMYVPQIAVPNYPNNPAYPHPSNGSSYLLMPGANSHITANGLKYKPTPLANPTAYGAFTNPAGYTISSPGALLGAGNLDDVSRMKYKDSNLYVPNVQAESASEIWVQTPRDLPGVQSSHYFNIAGQASHGAYLPTHAAHASFNAAVQPSHIQFPGLFHPPQQTAMPNPHHLVHQQVPPSMGGNIAVGMASPTAPIASFQQAQLGHSWPGNF